MPDEEIKEELVPQGPLGEWVDFQSIPPLPERAEVIVRAPTGPNLHRRAFLVKAMIDLLLYGAEETVVGMAYKNERVTYRKVGPRTIQAELYFGTLQTTTLLVPHEHMHLKRFLEEQGFTFTVEHFAALPLAEE